MVGLLGLLLAAPCAVESPPGVTAALDYRDGGWRLEARKDESVLRRRIDLPADDCALAADTAALMIDRFVHALGPAPRPRPQPAEPKPATVIARAAESDALRPPPPLAAPEILVEPPRRVLLPEPEVAVRERDFGNDSAPRAWRWALSAGAAGSLSGDDVRPGVWLDLTGTTGRWALSVSLATATGTADLEHRHGTTDGMSLDSGLLAISAKPCVDFGVRACLGPFAGARILSGDSLRESFVALQAEGGAALQLDRTFAGGFSFSAALLVGYTAGPLSHEALETAGSRVDVTAALTLGYQVF